LESYGLPKNAVRGENHFIYPNGVMLEIVIVDMYEGVMNKYHYIDDETDDRDFWAKPKKLQAAKKRLMN
jgi:hypothetical protein